MPKMCAFATHPLKDGVLVTNRTHIAFIHKSRPEFRPYLEVCRRCKFSMEHVYKVKTERAKKLKESRNGQVSTLSSSMDSIDYLVNASPQHKKMSRRTESSQPSSFMGTTSSNSQLLIDIQEKSLQTKSKKRNSQEPTTSAAAAKAKKSSTNATIIQKPTKSRVITELADDDEAPIDNQHFRNSQEPTTSAATANAKKSAKIIQKPTKSRVITELADGHNDTVASITIYNDDEAPTDSQHFRNSQEPTTSAAAANANVIVIQDQKQMISLKPRGIRDYFAPVGASGSAGNSHTTATDSSSGLESSDDATLRTVIARTEQASISSRPLNGHVYSNNNDAGDSDDDNPPRSLNYYNPDVRYPEYQPIPRRRQFQHPNPQIMDIYSQGIRGG